MTEILSPLVSAILASLGTFQLQRRQMFFQGRDKKAAEIKDAIDSAELSRELIEDHISEIDDYIAEVVALKEFASRGVKVDAGILSQNDFKDVPDFLQGIVKDLRADPKFVATSKAFRDSKKQYKKLLKSITSNVDPYEDYSELVSSMQKVQESLFSCKGAIEQLSARLTHEKERVASSAFNWFGKNRL